MVSIDPAAVERLHSQPGVSHSAADAFLDPLLDGRIPANGPGGVRSQRIRTESEVRALKETESAAGAYTANPALLRLRELETLRDLARNANARIYIGFDKHLHPDSDGKAT